MSRSSPGVRVCRGRFRGRRHRYGITVRGSPGSQGARAGRGRRQAARRPWSARWSRPGTLSPTEGLDKPDTRQVGYHRAVIRRSRSGVAHRQDFLLFLLFSVRFAVPADGRLLQADGHEPQPVRSAHRVQAIRRVLGRSVLGRLGWQVRQGTSD